MLGIAGLSMVAGVCVWRSWLSRSSGAERGSKESGRVGRRGGGSAERKEERMLKN